MSALQLTDPTLYHQLKKARRKRGPKWSVAETNDLLDALRAYVVEKGYPSSSEHGKSDEWSLICASARQSGRFTGYQACNRVSNLRKDLNAYLENTHLRFKSDAQQNAAEIVAQHFPHAQLDAQKEKEQEIAEYIRAHCKLTTDWCSLVEMEDGPDTLPSPYYEDICKQLHAAKNKNADLYGYHARFRLISDAMRASQSAAGERKRARAKRKADGEGSLNGGDVSGVAGESAGAAMDGSAADALAGAEQHGAEPSVHGLELGDEHAVMELLPPLTEHDDDGASVLIKHDHDQHMSLPQQLHQHSHHHMDMRLDESQQQQQQPLQHTVQVDKKPPTLPPSTPATKAPRRRPLTEDVGSSSHALSEKRKKLSSSAVIAQLQAALLDVEAVRARRRERIEEAFHSKAEWYDKLLLTEEERARIDRHVRGLVGVFGVTQQLLDECLDPVSVGTWKKLLDRYE